MPVKFDDSPPASLRTGRPRTAATDPLVKDVPLTVCAWAAGVLEARGSRIKNMIIVPFRGSRAPIVLGRLRKYFGGNVSVGKNNLRWVLIGTRVDEMLAKIENFLSPPRVDELKASKKEGE